MRQRRYVIIGIALLICMSVQGCHLKKSAPKRTIKITQTQSTDQTDQEDETYMQMLLFIQQGLNNFGVKGTFTAYFAPGDVKNIQEIILEGDHVIWQETIRYSYDDEKDWYDFQGYYEPVLSQDMAYAEQSSDELDRVKSTYVFREIVSGDDPLDIAPKFDATTAPVIHDGKRAVPRWLDSAFQPYLYTYMDKRRDMRITIEYPQIAPGDNVSENLANTINRNLRNGFFYGYGREPVWDPGKEMYGVIERSYKITREDEECVSMRIYESNRFRTSNHENEWEYGLTINLKTGEVVPLKAVIGTAVIPADLLEQGLFKCLWVNGSGKDKDVQTLEKEWIDRIVEEYKEFGYSSDDLNKLYYLTDDSLGLITGHGKDYTCMEAKFKDLKITRE